MEELLMGVPPDDAHLVQNFFGVLDRRDIRIGIPISIVI